MCWKKQHVSPCLVMVLLPHRGLISVAFPPVINCSVPAAHDVASSSARSKTTTKLRLKKPNKGLTPACFCVALVSAFTVAVKSDSPSLALWHACGWVVVVLAFVGPGNPKMPRNPMRLGPFETCCCLYFVGFVKVSDAAALCLVVVAGF